MPIGTLTSPTSISPGLYYLCAGWMDTAATSPLGDAGTDDRDGRGNDLAPGQRSDPGERAAGIQSSDNGPARSSARGLQGGYSAFNRHDASRTCPNLPRRRKRQE